MSFKILGTGSYAPEHVVTNDDLSALVDTNDEWITQRIGVRSRHISETETNVDMAVKAAERALENAGISADELDLIIATTITGDTLSPGTGCMVQNRIGAHCPAFDLAAACSGFLFALETAAGFLSRVAYNRVLVVSAERMSGIIDWTDRGTCCIFGDGAGAVVVDGGEGLFHAHLTSDGNAVPLNLYPNPGNSPFAINPKPMTSLYMDGPEIYRFAVSHSTADLRTVVEEAGLALDEIDHYLLHQANKRILDAVRARLKQPEEKFPSNVYKRGNCSSASIPILLDEINRAGELHKGDKLALSAFGAGLTTGACVLSWTRD